MTSYPPGYQPVNNVNQDYTQGQPIYGQPVGYVPQNPFEPGYNEYQARLRQMEANGGYLPPAGRQNHSTDNYPKPQQRYMSGFSYNDRRHRSNSDVKIVRTNDPVSLYCENCQAQVNTQVISYPGPYAWGACAVCCLMGCFICCCVPLCLDPLNHSRHFCDRCNKLLAENN